MKYATCVASWFWLGTQRNKGMQGQRNSEEIGAGAMRNRLPGQMAFLGSPNACVWIVLRKTESTYQRSVDRSVINLKYLMEKQGNCVKT